MSLPHSDPQNAVIEDYVTPSGPEMAARKKRNWAIAIGLMTFIALVFMITLYQFGTM